MLKRGWVNVMIMIMMTSMMTLDPFWVSERATNNAPHSTADHSVWKRHFPLTNNSHAALMSHRLCFRMQLPRHGLQLAVQQALDFNSGIAEVNELRVCTRVSPGEALMCATRDVRGSDARVKIDLVTSGRARA